MPNNPSDKYLPRQSSDLIDELLRRDANQTHRINQLERKLKAFGSDPLPRIDIETYPDPHEGQRAIHAFDEQHAWYSNGKWRKAGGKFEGIVFSSEQALVAGNDANGWFMVIPEDLDDTELYHAHAAVYNDSSSGAVSLMVRNVTQAVDMLSTAITIDSGENTSYTAATQPVISTTNDDVATGNIIVVDADSIGTGTEGLVIILHFS